MDETESALFPFKLFDLLETTEREQFEDVERTQSRKNFKLEPSVWTGNSGTDEDCRWSYKACVFNLIYS